MAAAAVVVVILLLLAVAVVLLEVLLDALTGAVVVGIISPTDFLLTPLVGLAVEVVVK